MTPQFHGGRSGSSRGPRHKPAPAAASSKSSEAIRPLDPTLTPPDITTFRHWELGEEIQVAIEGMGITTPSPIQRLAIGPVLAGKDVIAKAETGTGKTLAFGAPMMAKIDPARASVLGLVMCPTRELAEQVQKVLSELGKPRGIEVALIVGGEPMEPQVKALKRGAQVVVGTPGRILDLYKQKFLSFPWTEFAILDEADVMFEFGFIDDVKEILSYTPEERQTLLFSATFPAELLKLARGNTRDPAEVATAAGLKTVDNIEQSVIFLDDEDRTLALMRLIENSDPEDVFLVFCPRRTDVDKLIRRLERMPFGIKALHGGYDQAARFRVMAAFRTGEVKALIATDVASRGLDVKHVSTVVNYGSPHDITDYTHRIGRTGRAGRKGRAITLVGGIDRRKWTQIEREATWKIPEVDPPLRGERPRPRRDETPPEVVLETEARPQREERPARRTTREQPEVRAPRAQAPARGRAREEFPSNVDAPVERPRTAAPRPAPARSKPAREDAPRETTSRGQTARETTARGPAPRESTAARGESSRAPAQRAEAPRSRSSHGSAPRAEQPSSERQRDEAPRHDGGRRSQSASRAEPREAAREPARPRSASSRAPESRDASRPNQSGPSPSGPSQSGPNQWPRDEHSPARAPVPRELDRQIEPRPDDPVDRRDRPLRHRAEAPRWPADDDAPREPRRAAPPEAPRAREGAPVRRAQSAAPERQDTRARDVRAPEPRDERSGRRPAAASASERPRAPAPGRAPAHDRAPAFDAVPPPERDFRPRGPDPERRPATRAEAPRPPARRDDSPPREPRRRER